ncbi:MAG: FAD:protein FMN transferase [Phycisphaerae bacterium]|nr:FAD:protein FMN transferase [Phycisphaerae bacterium]
MTTKPPEVFLVNSHGDAVKGVHRFSHDAMATVYEVLIQHDDFPYSRQAAMEVFSEIDRIEQELSRYIPNSDIGRINTSPPGRPVQIGLEAFECLRIACRLYEETDGAFDVTIGSLFRCLLDEKKQPRSPSPEALHAALARTGAHLLRLDPDLYTVTVAVEGVQVDLGGIGKGFTVDRIAAILREWGIDKALVHGGYSSVLALDAPDGSDGWPITFSNPEDGQETLVRLSLKNQAVNGSGRGSGHIIDPRKARPVLGRLASWSCTPDAASGDALSTAFMIMTGEEIRRYCDAHRRVRALVIADPHTSGGIAHKQTAFQAFGAWENGQILVPTA